MQSGAVCSNFSTSSNSVIQILVRGQQHLRRFLEKKCASAKYCKISALPFRTDRARHTDTSLTSCLHRQMKNVPTAAADARWLWLPAMTTMSSLPPMPSTHCCTLQRRQQQQQQQQHRTATAQELKGARASKRAFHSSPLPLPRWLIRSLASIVCTELARTL